MWCVNYVDGCEQEWILKRTLEHGKIWPEDQWFFRTVLEVWGCWSYGENKWSWVSHFRIENHSCLVFDFCLDCIQTVSSPLVLSDINRLYPSFCSWKMRIMWKQQMPIARENLRSNFGQQFGCFFSYYKSNRLLSWHFGKNVALLIDNFQKFGCYAKINCWMLGYLWHPWFVHQETSCHCEYEAIANAAKDLVALVGRTSTAAHVGTRRGRTSSRSWGDGSGSL